MCNVCQKSINGMAKKAKKGARRRRSRVNGLNTTGIVQTLTTVAAGGLGIVAAAYAKDKIEYLGKPENALIGCAALAVVGALGAGMVGNGMLKAVMIGAASAGATVAISSFMSEEKPLPALYGAPGVGYLPSPNPWENRSRQVSGIKLQ